MLVTNSRTLFHFNEKKNLIKNQKVSKYSDHDCLGNSFLFFMSLLTAQIIKNSHIPAGIYFIFLRKIPGPNLKIFQYQFRSH